MDLILQLWGGGFYLANKICFALAESRSATRKRQLRIGGWVIYLLGVPAWVVILVGKHDWIAASIEAGGVPAMLFGLYNVCRHISKPDPGLDRLTSWITYAFLLFGVAGSVVDFGGLTSITQILEIGVMIGFLLGTYLLAKQDFRGWLFFMLMNASMGSLMLLQGKPILAVQQSISLCFVIYGFTVAAKVKRQTAARKDQS
ncbi:MAG TPA: nicotinamide mononucleotide transporter [Desulfuromonadales bacterium]|nr:nicotinamide mononucleotide transporter [Desulfuromonadales bacterium]